jgi:mRNA-degrading endonuclease toxin of MazEF toxin-antitoxin module
MPHECALTLDNITVMPKGYLTERICRLRAERMVETCAALAIASGCA